ncbi:hypothetical protein KV205_10480 [Streptomyces sp. SKN60]|uniref:hypothetical protein n=1 Tax=Streptomyces sp. SKN60 TaxID=2855506 RepID=UPI00224570B5|nr:hypothetical protein [Streptomyces sp. SKN60]MCX2180954.1 hypothetical protein [Streptomyces sp. SKN60]
MPEDRTFWRMLRVSMLVLFLEAALALILGVVFGESREPEPGEEPISALTLVFLPFFAVFALLATAAVSAAVVAPSVLLGEAAARRIGGRFGGRALGWQLLLAGAACVLVWPLAGWRGWLVAWACLGVAGAVARHARRGLFVRVLGWGTLTLLAVFGLGGLGLWAGVVGS